MHIDDLKIKIADIVDKSYDKIYLRSAFNGDLINKRTRNKITDDFINMIVNEIMINLFDVSAENLAPDSSKCQKLKDKNKSLEKEIEMLKNKIELLTGLNSRFKK